MFVVLKKNKRELKPFIYNTKSLQTLCHNVVDKHFYLSKELFYLRFYGNLGYTFFFEKVIREIERCVNSEAMLRERSFEKWFRKEVKLVLEKIELDLDSPKEMIRHASYMIRKTEIFRKVFGVAKEALSLFLQLRRSLRRYLD